MLFNAPSVLDGGESYRSVAADLPISRQGLSNIYQDDERRAWYLNGEVDNDRVDVALDAVRTPHSDDDTDSPAHAGGSGC